MALVLTLISMVLAYFSPGELLPKLAPYHLQQFILLPAVAASLAGMAMRQASLQSPQYILMIGLWFGVVMSAMSRLWLRTSLEVFIAFSVLVCLYFLVLVNAFTLGRVRVLYIVILLCALIMAAEGILAYHTGFQGEQMVLERLGPDFQLVKRIRAYGVLADPNDFSQFLLVGLAALGIFWKKGNLLANLVLLGLPGLILIYAIYLTFSRGAMIGLAVIALVALATRLGRLQSLAATAVLFLMMLAFRFGAGRDISLNEGSAAGRVMAWGTGIGLLKENPLFGVGYGRFTEYNTLTAHNSFVLCFAELGIFGYFFWLGLVLTTAIGLERVAKLPAATEEDALYHRYVTTTRAAFYSFLATSWFLSRTYNVTLYLLLGLAAALIYLREQRHPELALRPGRWIPVTLAGQVASVVLIYITIRLRAL